MFKIKELADLLQLNQQTVRNMVNRGELEFVKIGRTKFIPREAAVKLAGGTGLEMPELLTVEQVAELLKLSKATLWNWINAGTFPAGSRGGSALQDQALRPRRVPRHNPYAKADRFWSEAASRSEVPGQH
jgi:excisionase family DNA binding protein